MSGLILPGGQPAIPTKDPGMVDYDSLSEEQKARIAAMAEQEDPEDHMDRVITAFTVVLDTTGHWLVSPSINLPILPDRDPDAQDYVTGSSAILHDVQSVLTATKTQQAMIVLQQQAMKQMENAQIAQRLGLKK